MGKFGKKNVVSLDLSRYQLGVMGPSGFGKTTLMYEVCNKLYGDDGYIVLDIGSEDGVAAINGVVSERVPNFGVLNEIVTDIVKNKDSEYPNLKVVIIDTLDAYFEIIEDYAIKDWNARNTGKPDFVKAKSINAVEGGYGHGMNSVIDMAKKIFSKLYSVGVGIWWTAHIKEKDQVDLYTGNSFAKITANMMSKYFNAIKDTTHVVACGYYDRTVETTEVGRENPITKKKKERSTIVNEVRKLKFRDDMLVADAKSRFASIVDEIPLDRDLFIKAIEDAISAAREGNEPVAPAERIIEAPSIVAAVSSYDTVEEKEEEVSTSLIINEDEDGVEVSHEATSIDRAKVIAEIRSAFKELPKETKAIIKNLKGDVELDAAPDDILIQIKDLIDEEFEVIA